MADYWVNNRAQANGDHEVHVAGCVYMPADKLYLGNFLGCAPAVEAATRTYPQSNGCYYCARACHTG
jgi:hypothetical protein